jgi:hypothetical protein
MGEEAIFGLSYVAQAGARFHDFARVIWLIEEQTSVHCARAISRVAGRIDHGYRRLRCARSLGHIPAAQGACKLNVREDEIDLPTRSEELDRDLAAAGFQNAPARIAKHVGDVVAHQPFILYEENYAQGRAGFHMSSFRSRIDRVLAERNPILTVPKFCKFLTFVNLE